MTIFDQIDQEACLLRRILLSYEGFLKASDPKTSLERGLIAVHRYLSYAHLVHTHQCHELCKRNLGDLGT